jgi:carboxyl-terminal processing protease
MIVPRTLGVLLPALALFVVTAAAQEWRTVHLAAFDEAWQTINDTYFDPAFGGLDWAGVKSELRPRAEKADSPDEVRAVIREMLGRLKQSHFALLSPASTQDALPGAVRAPIDIRIIDGEAVIVRRWGGEEDRLRPGQALVEIDGKTIREVVGPLDGLTGRARDFEMWRRVYRALHGPEGSQASLTVRQIDGREHALRIRRMAPAAELVTLGNLPPLEVQFTAREQRTPAGRRVGVIGFSVWMALVGDRFAQAIDAYRNAAGIVIDLRGNPGGLALLMTRVAGHFFPEDALLGVMRMRQATLEFRANPQRSTMTGEAVPVFAGPVAILVDELTASASETFAAGMQSLGRARIFGARTMGQALPAATRRLPTGDVLMHAVGDFVTSTGRGVEGGGVVPDVPVALTRAALASGRDPVLEAALAWIDRGHFQRASTLDTVPLASRGRLLLCSKHLQDTHFPSAF